jgi:hypothetical protein
MCNVGWFRGRRRILGVRPGVAIGMFWMLCALNSGCRSRPVKCVPGPQATCAGADLSHQQLGAMDLTGANLAEAKLVGTDLSGAILLKANLRHADLSAAHLDDANLRLADLAQAFLTNVQAERADFTGATLRDAVVGGVFDDAKFGGVDFTGALSHECLGNAPTTVPGTPFDAKKGCAIRNLYGRRITCPDGSTSRPERPACEGHMTLGQSR